MNTSKRASRSKKSVPVFQCPNIETWSISEMKLLLTAIKRHGLKDIQILQSYIPSRSEKEISWYISKIKNSKKYAKKPICETPIEKWMNLILELTFYEHEDYSRVLSSVMAVIAHGECSENSTEASTSSEVKFEEPNYSRMYQYIEALLSCKQPPELSKVEAAIFIDLMYSLADQLRTCQANSETVKDLLLYKYELLNERVDQENKKENTENIRLALENEWPADNKYGLPVAEGKGKTRTKGGSRKRTSQSKRSVVTSEECAQANVFPTSDQDKYTEDVPRDTTIKRPRGGMHASGSNTTDEVPVTKQNVSMPEGQSQQPNEQSELSPLQASSSVHASSTDEPKIFRKPLLYTLNPLCIPVSLLNLNNRANDKSE